MRFCSNVLIFLDFSKLEKLKEELLHTAEFISGEKSYLAINKDIQTVKLQISKNSLKTIDESNYSKRRRDPELLNQARQGDIKLVDLFKQAEELAKEQAKRATRNDAAEKKYIAIHGNCVGVSGQAGIGKTTLTKQLVEKVLKKELLDVDFLFYVSLKKVNYEEKLNVLQLLLTDLDSSWEHDPASDKVLLKQLEESGKVMIIFDGLDEVTIELEKQCPNAKLYDVTTPEILLKNILNGNIFRKAKKLITSRPRQMLELWKECRPHCIVDVLGIDLKAQREISKTICGDDSEKVLVELLNHPELAAQCYVPIICIFTIYWLHQNMHHSEKIDALATATNIILNVLQTFVTYDIARNEFELEKLSKLAWEGLSCKKYEFSEQEIHKSKLKKESLNTLLTTNTQICLLYVEKITYFSHQILQEFFSAIYLILFLSVSGFKHVLSDNGKKFGNLHQVKKFIFGLCNSTTYKRLTNLQTTLFSDNTEFNKKKLLLKTYVCQIAQDLSSDDFSKYLEICSMLYEKHDQELTKKIVESFPGQLIISSRHNIFPHDVGSLNYVLQERQKLLEVEINNPTFIGDSLQRIFNKIASMPKCISVSLKNFRFEILHKIL